MTMRMRRTLDAGMVHGDQSGTSACLTGCSEMSPCVTHGSEALRLLQDNKATNEHGTWPLLACRVDAAPCMQAVAVVLTAGK